MDIKNAIERKHIISNSYKEPPDLLSETDLKQQDDSKFSKYFFC